MVCAQLPSDLHVVHVAFSTGLWSGNLLGIMWDFIGSPVRRMRHNRAAGRALWGVSADSPSLLTPLFQEEWEFIICTSSCGKRRVNQHRPSWTWQVWPGGQGNEPNIAFIWTWHAQKSSSMWCTGKSYMPGPQENPFPASHWCVAVLGWGTSVQSWRELCETSVEPTLFSETEFSLALLLHSPASAQPRWFGHHLNTNPVLSCPVPAGPGACSSAWGWPGCGQPWSLSPAQPRLLRWSCRMRLVEEEGTALP